MECSSISVIVVFLLHKRSGGMISSIFVKQIIEEDTVIAVPLKTAKKLEQAEHRMDSDLWEKVHGPHNEYQRQLIGQLESIALPEIKIHERIFNFFAIYSDKLSNVLLDNICSIIRALSFASYLEPSGQALPPEENRE
ncbi:unnamed protein product [Dovyalis caffra]|uniref:Uncharacterized protein n=1 Tax=Dovyalis caffra TaxID=77055 RepID=A0AAV1RD32_9ROSI|nr:unnamed protein product [Dovyalis caffra]